MTDDHTPLTDEQVGEIVLRDEVAFRMHSTRVTQSEMDRAALLADREHYKRRAETAEREALRDDMPPMIGDPRGGRGPAGW